MPYTPIHIAVNASGQAGTGFINFGSAVTVGIILLILYIWLWMYRTETAVRLTAGLGTLLFNVVKGVVMLLVKIVVGIATWIGSLIRRWIH